VEWVKDRPWVQTPALQKKKKNYNNNNKIKFKIYISIAALH
jgi:hypothetical protein